MSVRVGVDLGNSSIKIVQLEANKESNKLISFAAGAAPPQILTATNPVEVDAIVNAIKSVVNAAKPSTNNVIVGLPEALVFTRVIEMPVLNDKELDSAIRWEAEQYVPVPLDEVNLVWQVIFRPEQSTPGSKMEVFIVAAPKTLVDHVSNLMKKSGLVPIAIETEIIAMARSIVGNNPYSPTSMLISIGQETTDLCVVRAANIAFTRSISTGGMALTRAIAEEMKFEIPQAEEYKKSYGVLPDQLDGKIAAAIRPVLDVVISEVRRAMAFYQEHKPDDPVKRISLCGGGAKLPGLPALLAESIGIEAQLGDPWFNIIHPQRGDLVDDGPIYAIAAGLALKEV